MTTYVRDSETVDHCPSCGTLHVSLERGSVVARSVDTGLPCKHTWIERNAMRDAELKQLRDAVVQEREAKHVKRRPAAV